MAEEEFYEDDFEDYEDDVFEEDTDIDSPTSKVSRHAQKIPSLAWELISLDELDVGEKIASGAMGSVHLAYWRGRSVAAKTLHDTSPEALYKIEQELLVHASLRHPRIVALLGARLTPHDCWIVMERCEESLFHRLHARSGIDLDRRVLLRMAMQVADGMAFLHNHSPPVVHRDLKSHNVLLDQQENCKICDFGLVNIKEARPLALCWLRRRRIATPAV